MKMSDEFSLPLRVEGYLVVSEEYKIDGVYHYKDEIECDNGSNAKAVCVAINMHDKLVDALESMASLNMELIRDHNKKNPPWKSIDEEHIHDAFMLIKEAKGES